MKQANPVDLSPFSRSLDMCNSLRVSGRVVQVIGLTIEAVGLDCQIGEVCEIRARSGETILSEVVGFRNSTTLLMPLGNMEGIQPDSSVYPQKTVLRSPVGSPLLGRVLDGLGEPIDGKGPLGDIETRPINNAPPHPMERRIITEPLVTGVRAIDGFLTCGKGQRMGIFAGSGVGKSTLMGSIARSSQSDVSVIGLIGERGREVRDLLKATWVRKVLKDLWWWYPLLTNQP